LCLDRWITRWLVCFNGSRSNRDVGHNTAERLPSDGVDTMHLLLGVKRGIRGCFERKVEGISAFVAERPSRQILFGKPQEIERIALFALGRAWTSLRTAATSLAVAVNQMRVAGNIGCAGFNEMWLLLTAAFERQTKARLTPFRTGKLRKSLRSKSCVGPFHGEREQQWLQSA